MDRDKIIIKVSIQGIIVNLILVIFKAAIGLMVNSIAIILDAVNNLSDAISQVITIAGTKLSSKAPDKEHPYGYGRIEYITSVIIAVIVLFAGITSFKESLLKSIHPEPATYTSVSILIIAVAVVVKFTFGKYVKSMGDKVSSQSLIASGTDAFMDSILSCSTLIAALISMKFHISIDGYLGVILSLFILKAGFEILKETLNSIIGGRVDSEFSLELKKEIKKIDGVYGAYDLVLHDYGPSRSIGSVHIEVEDSLTTREIDYLQRKVISEIHDKYGIVLTVGIYAKNDSDPVIVSMRKEVSKIIQKYEHVLQFHGFYVDFEKKYISFDIVVSFHAADPFELRNEICSEVINLYEHYHCDVSIDYDFSD